MTIAFQGLGADDLGRMFYGEPKNPFAPTSFYEDPTNWLLAALVVIAGVGLFLYIRRNKGS